MPDTVANPTRRDNVADATPAPPDGQQTRQIARAAVRRFRLAQAVTPVRVLTLVLDDSREVTRG